jgi:hypothetical protein
VSMQHRAVALHVFLRYLVRSDTEIAPFRATQQAGSALRPARPEAGSRIGVVLECYAGLAGRVYEREDWF